MILKVAPPSLHWPPPSLPRSPPCRRRRIFVSGDGALFPRLVEKSCLYNQSSSTLYRSWYNKRSNFGIIPISLSATRDSIEEDDSDDRERREKERQNGIVVAGESAYCSMNKAFSSMVLIIRELHSYTLRMRSFVSYEDLQRILADVQKEIHCSFVWLFQTVFSQTPTLMVYVMILLANYSVHSMSCNAAFTALHPSTSTTEVIKISSAVDVGLKDRSKEVLVDEDYMRTKILYEAMFANEPNNSLFLSNYAQFLCNVVKDLDRAEEFFKRAIKAEPRNADALSKYANFLWVVRNDLCAAEQTYKEAMEVEPSISTYAAKYAYFLWLIAS